MYLKYIHRRFVSKGQCLYTVSLRNFTSNLEMYYFLRRYDADQAVDNFIQIISTPIILIQPDVYAKHLSNWILTGEEILKHHWQTNWQTNRRTGGDVKRERRQSSMKNGACGLQPPKRVITAYFQFCREQRPRVTQEMHNRNLSMSLIDVTRELAKRY